MGAHQRVWRHVANRREVFAAAAKKEYTWNHLSPEDKALWTKAAEKGWQAYVDNAAVEVLDLKQSTAVRKNLALKGEFPNPRPATAANRCFGSPGTAKFAGVHPRDVA